MISFLFSLLELLAIDLDMPAIAILKTGSAPEAIRLQHGDFEDWFRILLAASQLPIICIDATSGRLPDPSQYAGVVVTGAAAMVTDHLPWSDDSAAWLRRVHEQKIPLLGVCYGHQLLADALGGVVADNPGGRIIGGYRFVAESAARRDVLFAPLPEEFSVQKTHCQQVVRLPPGAVGLGATPGDPYAAFRMGRSSWGVQFHPEFSSAVTAQYVAARREKLTAEGLDVPAVLSSVAPSDLSQRIVSGFAAYCATYLTDTKYPLQGNG